MTDTVLPAFVVDGEYDDAEWRAVASGQVRPEDRTAIILAGPRRHPFNPFTAYEIEADGRRLIFPTKEAADAYAGPFASAKAKVKAAGGE